MMKKILNTVLVVSALLLTACTVEKGPVFNPEDAVPPVLDSVTEYELSDSVEVFAELTFTPADFGISTAKSYTAYVDLSGNDFASQRSVGTIIGTPDVEKETMTIESADFNSALLALGCEVGAEVEAEIRIGASIMGESSAVAGTEVFSESVSVTVTVYSMEKVYDMVYVTGAPWGWPQAPWDPNAVAHLYSYAEDEENYVGVVDFGADCADYSFKITGATNWDNGNWGSGSMTSTDPEAPSITLWDDGGSGNITNYSTYRYYSFHFVKSSLTLNMNKGFNSVKVAGTFNGWVTDDTNTDEMIQIASSGKFYIDLEISESNLTPDDGEFKFILDNGATWIGTGEEEGSVSIGGGGNIEIGEAGNYRFYLDLNDWDNPTYELSAEDYGAPVE